MKSFLLGALICTVGFILTAAFLIATFEVFDSFWKFSVTEEDYSIFLAFVFVGLVCVWYGTALAIWLFRRARRKSREVKLRRRS